MPNEVFQQFTRGINRRFPREESSSPEFFYTLQNARILNRGDTGRVSRINGYTKFNSNGTDFSNVIDSIFYKDNYIVLYESVSTAGNYSIEVFDNTGTLQQTLNYSDESLSDGSLKKNDNTIFIAPHNKVLFYDGSSWSLKDMKSTIPDVSSTGFQSFTPGQASGSIEPTSGPSSISEINPTGKLTIVQNNVPINKQDSITVSVGGVSTDAISVDYKDTEKDIAKEIYRALIGGTGYTDPGITTDWEISMSPGIENQESNGTNVYLTKKTGGPTNDRITVSSDYNITDLNRDRYSRFEGDPNPFDISNREHEFKGLNSFQVATILVSQPTGGKTSSTNLGPLYVRFENIGTTVKTENILTTDTATQIADKIKTAVDNQVAGEFNISRSTNTITLTAKESGKKYNGKILMRFSNPTFSFASDIFSVNKSDFTGGEEVDVNLTLERETDYWYKARYKYIDGHVSSTCFPGKINTGPSKGIKVTFNTPERDLDGTRPKLQVFRKEEGGNFFLVDEFDITSDTTDFIDDGKLEKGRFEEADLVWSETHKTHDIVDNRYVRANITYPTEIYSEGSFNINSATTSSNESLPNNTKARIYVQPQYADGTKGYFSEAGFYDIKNSDKVLTIEQTSLLSNSDKNINELGFYVNYHPHAEEFYYKINTFELANPNIPLIEDNQRYPSSTRILLGFKTLRVISRDGSNNHIITALVNGWDIEGTERDHYGFVVDVKNLSGPIGTDGVFPRKIDMDILGKTMEYDRIATQTGGNFETAIYQMADYQALKEAAQSGKLKIKLTNSPVTNLSSKTSNDEILEVEVAVKNIIDKTEGRDNIRIQSEDDKELSTAPDTRLYLELEESPLDDIDNLNVTKYQYKINHEPILGLKNVGNLDITGMPTEEFNLDSYTLGFELINFKHISDSSFVPYTSGESGQDSGRKLTGEFDVVYYAYDWDYATYELIDVDVIIDDDVGVFIGSKENSDDTGSPVTFDITGFTFEEKNSLFINKLRPENIYSNLTFKDDLNLDKKKYKNQIIWSDELNQGTGFSGGRDFRTEAFFNISDENGEIRKIMSLNNKLFIFCENGVAVANIGEVLTTQRSGEVFVDASQFITNYYWVNDKLIDVDPNSIVKYKNTIYFTDGYDVFGINQQGFKNLTQGIIDLDPSNKYYGGINPKYNEYQLCDYTNSETWAFNINFNQWYGPFTYKFKNSIYNELEYITIDDSLYKQDTGNTFNGTSYKTIIENAADDTEKSFYDKNFRKFYIGTKNNSSSIFKYGKDPNSLISVSMGNMTTKNGYKHQGITPKESNSKSIFWEIETTDNNFKLSDLGWRFSLNRRR